MARGGLSFTMAGHVDLHGVLGKKRKQLLQAFVDSVRDEAEEVMRVSKERYVPIRTGALRDSGKVSEPVVNKGEVEVELTYGNKDVNYAVYVHENLTANHPHGQAKYLEEPVNAASVGMLDRVGRGVLERLKRP